MAFIIAISFLLVAGGLIVTGHDVAGGVLGAVDLLGLVSVFLYRNRGPTASVKARSPKAPPIPRETD